jgi:uncharacterized protein YjbI with pentapeptide repeats
LQQPSTSEEQALPSSVPDATRLLDAVNSSTEHVAVLHAAFIAACAYVIVIASGRTDLDLLIGKGIKLPFLDTEVSVVGFFAAAPWILVIVHFNLLLHLQLHSRKLHAFDLADENGMLRDQLRIFPITWYIVGRTDPRTRRLLSLMISITLLLIPLLTLLILQLQFLAYQSEQVTWGQRLAIWLDLAQLVYFWPIIIEKGDSSNEISAWWSNSHQIYIYRRRDWIPPTLLGIGLMLVICGTALYFLAGFITLLLSMMSSALLERGRSIRLAKISIFIALLTISGVMLKTLIFSNEYYSYIATDLTNTVAFIGNQAAIKWMLLSFLLLITSLEVASLVRKQEYRDKFSLLLAGVICLPLSLALQVDGEILEQLSITWQSTGEQSTIVSSLFVNNKRILDLNEKRLFANHPDPEIVAQLRSPEWSKALPKIESIDLQNRSLRHASLSNALCCRANLKKADLESANLNNAQLQGAVLDYAQLQGAVLNNAQLQGAALNNAQLQGAVLNNAQLQGAALNNAQLQGADLYNSQLQGAILFAAHLEGANLNNARLQNAFLYYAQLQGADLSSAQFNGADLRLAQLQGADMRKANIYGANFNGANTTLIDARDMSWIPLNIDDLSKLRNDLKDTISVQNRSQKTLDHLQRAAMKKKSLPRLESSLATDQLPFPCVKRYDCSNPKDLAAFRQQLHLLLADIATYAPEIARGIIHQIPEDNSNNSSRFGLAAALVKRLDTGSAEGLQALRSDEQAILRSRVKESKSRRQ